MAKNYNDDMKFSHSLTHSLKSNINTCINDKHKKKVCNFGLADDKKIIPPHSHPPCNHPPSLVRKGKGEREESATDRV